MNPIIIAIAVVVTIIIVIYIAAALYSVKEGSGDYRPYIL